MRDRPDGADRWQRMEQLFHAALEQPPERRADFLDRACGSDRALRLDLESLLASASAGDSLLERPAMAHSGLADNSGAEQPSWMPGTIVGSYRIVERLGAGGMGEVFRARDTVLGRDVAVKTLPPPISRDRSYLRRFRREAQVLASLNHPNVATLYGIVEAGGVFGLVMELVEGETLENRLRAGRLTSFESLRIAFQVAEALEAAHRKGVVHRDLKPGNVMIARGGLVKVLDFGLAKRAQAGTQSSSRTPTATGVILGTAGYMSPEQVDGREVDIRSDIFSFGALCYEMVTGRKAFGRDTEARTVVSVLCDEPDPIQRCAPEVPKRMARIIDLCLRKDPDERYQHISDVKLALQELRDDLDRGETDPVVRVSRWSRRRRVIAGAASVAALTAAWYVAASMRSAVSPPTMVTPLTLDPGFAESPALAPDGKMVAFSWEGERRDNIDIFVKVVGSGEPLRLTSNPAPERGPIWSPDGRMIAFSRLRDTGGVASTTETIFTIPVLGGTERAVGPGTVHDWSPDGATLLVMAAPAGEPTGWFLLSVGDGAMRRLTTTTVGHTIGRGRFSPDGRKVYFVEATAPGESHLSEIDVWAGSPRRAPIQAVRAIDGFDWIGDREFILLARPRESVIPNLYTAAISGGAPRLLPFGRNASSIDVSANTATLVYSQMQMSENIWRVGAWPRMDRQPRRWIASEMPNLTPAMSPAGNRIAFSSLRSGHWGIWASDAEGNDVFPVTRFPSTATAMVGSPSWSPDGTKIAFDTYIGAYPNIFVAPLPGGEPRALTAGNERKIIPAWSPDGRWIYYTLSEATGQTIWRIPANGGEAQQITRQGGYSVKISPDGKFIYYLKSRRDGELWRAPADGGAEEPLVRDFKSRNFWVLAGGVYLLDPGVSEISPMRRAKARFYNFRTKQIEDLGFETEKPISHYGMCLSPDGKWLFYTQADRSGSQIMLVENFR